jgi:hypothetical protein
VFSVRYVSHLQFDEITSTRLAIDGDIKKCKVSEVTAQLKSDSDRPYVFQSERRFLPCQLSFVPWFMMKNCSIGFHDDLLLRRLITVRVLVAWNQDVGLIPG